MLTKRQFLGKVRQEAKAVDISLAEKAFDLALRAHTGQKRRDGTDFFSHPLNVALLTLKYSPDTESVCAALLHDTVEDTDITLDEISREFGEKVAFLVDGLTKVESKKSPSLNKTLTVKKVLKYGRQDPRVFMLKFADKLDNLKTLSVLPKDRQVEIVDELKTLYIPYARQLGLKVIEEEFTRQYAHYKRKRWI